MHGSPVKLSIDYPEELSRGKLLLKTFFGWLYVGIPHGFALMFYGIGAFVVTFIAWWAILFTGKYPRGMYAHPLVASVRAHVVGPKIALTP